MKPRDTETKRQRGKALVGEMIALYCKKRHGGHTPAQIAITENT